MYIYIYIYYVFSYCLKIDLAKLYVELIPRYYDDSATYIFYIQLTVLSQQMEFSLLFYPLHSMLDTQRDRVFKM